MTSDDGSNVPGGDGTSGDPSFPSARGFSRRNLKYMREFAEAWPDWAIVQRSAQLPRGRNSVVKWSTAVMLSIERSTPMTVQHPSESLQESRRNCPSDACIVAGAKVLSYKLTAGDSIATRQRFAAEWSYS